MMIMMSSTSMTSISGVVLISHHRFAVVAATAHCHSRNSFETVRISEPRDILAGFGFGNEPDLLEAGHLHREDGAADAAVRRVDVGADMHLGQIDRA